jgi:hypothetical protein
MRFLCLENATLLVRKIQLATSLYDEEDRDMNGGYGPLQSNSLPPKTQQKNTDPFRNLPLFACSN